MAMGSDMLATCDVAKILGVSSSRVRQFVMDRKLKPTGRIGINLLFDPAVVNAFARERKKNSATGIAKGKRER